MPHEVAGCGAAEGAVVARRKTRRAKTDVCQQVEQQSQQAQQATAEQIKNFKKAFSICLEGKKLYGQVLTAPF